MHLTIFPAMSSIVAANMTGEEYIQEIRTRLSSSFDFLEGGEWEEYGIAAVYRERDVMSAVFRENEVEWSASTEYCLVSADSGGKSLQSILAGLKPLALRLARPSRHHRLTVLTRVIAGSGWGEREKKEAVRFAFTRSFRLGFYGWVKCAVLLADLESGGAIANRAGQSKRKYFAPARST